MTKTKKVWGYAPSKSSSPTVPATVKAEVQQKANELVETFLKPQHVKPPPKDHSFNYIVDIYTKWYRHYFYFCARYACPGPNALAPSFEAKFARLEYVDGLRFNLAFMRFTEAWVELYRHLSLEQCLEAIQDDAAFHP